MFLEVSSDDSWACLIEDACHHHFGLKGSPAQIASFNLFCRQHIMFVFSSYLVNCNTVIAFRKDHLHLFATVETLLPCIATVVDLR